MRIKRFYPTVEQVKLRAKSFGYARFVWNNTLKYRTDEHYKDGTSIPHAEIVKNMIRNPKRTKLIADVSWGEFVHQLKHNRREGLLHK